MDPDKEIRADAKLKNLPEQALEDLWRFRNPEEDGEKLTLEAVAVQVQDTHGFSVSLSTLSEFFKWLRLKKRMQGARDRAEQARYALAKDPTMTPDDIAKVGQMVFTAETIEDGNVKAYVELQKLRLQAAKQEMELRKVVMLEKKAAFYDAIKEKANESGTGGVTAEQMEEIERKLKMM
jgi:hypothetical protein